MSKTRILFVDDEVSVLDGLRRMLRKQSVEWEMEFASSGAEALGKLAGVPFDVIVSDMQMPGMSGAILLERVMRDYPEVGRIVLSGHTDECLSIRASRVAHQFLAKPVEPEMLKSAIARARPKRNHVWNERIRSVVASCTRLPALPTLCAELTHLMQSDQADAKQVARVISRDLSMSAKILQLVNSSFFGIGRRISSVETAITLLGLVRIQALVLREELFTAFVLPRPVEHFSVEWLSHRSLQVAELARLISKEEKQGGDRPDQAFTAGLLHDIGLLVLACLQGDFPSVVRTVHQQRVPICRAEMAVLNVTHGEIGAYLLSLWGLPARIVEGVALHHTPLEVPYEGVCAVTAVHVADALLAEPPEPCDPNSIVHLLAAELSLEYLDRIGLGHRLPRWKELAGEVAGRSMEICT